MKVISRSWYWLALLPIAAWFCSTARTSSAPGDMALTRQAVSDRPAVAQQAIAALRAQGPTGLQALCAAYDREISRHMTVEAADAPADPQWPKIAAALDAVGQQKDCYASRLYWYTDFAQAERAAQATGRPILSLRLLGNLNEELSCANSRFFRTALYPNAQVSAYLRSHYILHWKSVRPVPTFTLDFGDGRKIVRTLTGNSIHYVLDSRGRVVDALPGLYGPQPFLSHLMEDEEAARRSAALGDGAQRAYVQTFHQAQFAELEQQWSKDCALAYGPRTPGPTLATLIAPIGNPRQAAVPPPALQAAPLAMSKAVVEMPVVSALTPGNVWAVGASPREWGWDQMGLIHRADATLDGNSRAVMAGKHPDLSRIPETPTTGPGFGLSLVRQQAATPAKAPLDQLIANFERSIAQDSVRNEYLYHAKLHQWFAQGQITGDVEALNRRVYSDLFLTPDSDTWLGLAPGGVYTALPQDGLIGHTPGGPATQLAGR